MSKNIRENGGSIPGIRPGEPTARYIGKIINRITLLGALLLSVVALFPIVFSQVSTFALGKAGYEQGLNVSLGGTSIIILVGVALETVKQLESAAEPLQEFIKSLTAHTAQVARQNQIKFIRRSPGVTQKTHNDFRRSRSDCQGFAKTSLVLHKKSLVLLCI